MTFRPLFPPQTRRGFLGTMAISAAAVAGASFAGPVMAQNIDEHGFLALSALLTGRDALDAGIASRALSALKAVDSGFSDKAALLSAAIQQERFTDMAKFDDFAQRHPDLKPVALAIISAWYLGYTGTPEGELNKDNACFVCYETALMYEPTLDVTIVPTFSRGKTNYWGEPPAVLSQN